MYKPYLVGITGGSASGKTRFLTQLLNNVDNKHVCLLSQDNYYRDIDQQPVDENGIQNFDLPECIDDQAYARDIQALKNGEKVIRKEYTFNNPEIEPKMLEFNPAPIIVVEGIFVLHYPEVANLLDLKIFIDAKEHLKMKRRIIRDSKERGQNLEEVLYRYEKHVHPTYEQYIEPYKEDADLIIPNNSHFDNALDVVSTYLQAKVMTAEIAN